MTAEPVTDSAGLDFSFTAGLERKYSFVDHHEVYNPLPAWSGLDQSSGAYWVMDSTGTCNALDPTQLNLTDFYSQSPANYGTCDELRSLVCVEQ